jgi:hypothetical protein
MTIFRSLISRLRRSILLKFVAGASLALVFSLPTLSQPPTRDKFLWPFSSTSPWNMPIGSGAIYIPANIQKAQSAGADLEYLFKLKEGDPLRDLYEPGAWGVGRCTGTTLVGIAPMPIPDDLIVSDATNVPYDTPNNASAFLLPDGKTLVQIGPLARCQQGGSLYGFHYYKDEDIYGDGLGGSHFGSGLSAIGGSIRKGELISEQPIQHALKVVIWGEKYFYYSQEIPGKRWPASLADNNAPNQYHGKNPALVQGTLLAILPNVTEESLNLQTPPAKKLFHALQDYGAYVADDAGWDCHYFGVEKGALEEFHDTYGYDFISTSGDFYEDFMKLFQALYVVDNNGPDSVGGGGTPRVALAPPIGN